MEGGGGLTESCRSCRVFCASCLRLIRLSWLKTEHGAGIKDSHTALLCELAFTATRSLSGHSCEVKQGRALLVAGWVTQALEQGPLGSCAHAG